MMYLEGQNKLSERFLAAIFCLISIIITLNVIFDSSPTNNIEYLTDMLILLYLFHHV